MNQLNQAFPPLRHHLASVGVRPDSGRFRTPMATDAKNGTHVLVAGASGHIGGHMVSAFHQAGYHVRALTRDKQGLDSIRESCDDIFVGEATRNETLAGLCDGVDVVVSSLGLRTFRAHPTPEMVDLQANLNILERACDAGVRRFVFVSVLHADQLLNAVPILRPRENFVQRLQSSGLDWTVLRPTGAFNDMEEIFQSAKRGWGIVLGDGAHRINPVHAADIAAVAVRSLADPALRDTDYEFGGPETYTQTEIVELAFEALGARRRVVHVPLWTVDAAAAIVQPFNRNAAGFMKFFECIATMDMVGTAVGGQSLAEFYRTLAQRYGSQSV